MLASCAMNLNGQQRWADQLLAMAPDLQRFARSLCRDPDLADDLVQDTFLRAWASAAQFKPGTNLGAWLFTILRNLYISERRKARRRVEDPGDENAKRLHVPPAQDAYLDQQDLGRALTRLPREQRQVLILVAIEGLTYEEASLACGHPIGTIKSRVQRGRTRLAALLKLDLTCDLGPDRIMQAALQLAA